MPRKRTTQLELIEFFSELIFSNKKVPSSSAFHQNRSKMNPNVMKEIVHELNNEFYTDNEETVKLYKGFRLLAVDGSRFTLPNTKELEKKYGTAVTPNKLKSFPTAQISCLYDIENKMIIDFSLAPFNASERVQAIEHLSHCKSKDLILFDRGYPSFELISELESRGIKYVMRVKKKYNLKTEAFVTSQKTSAIIEIPVPEELRKEYGKNTTNKVRFVRVLLEMGEEEILITNLLDEKKFPEEIFKSLYFKRWGIETNYDVLKNILEIENVSSYSPNNILQDIYSTFLLRNLQSIISGDLEIEIQKKYKHRKYKYKINTSISIGALNANLLELFMTNTISELLKKLKEVFMANVIPIRPDRTYERIKDKYGKRKKPIVLKNRKRVL